MTGYTSNLCMINSNLTDTNILKISKFNGDEILAISQNGDIYYNIENEKVKVNCPTDIIDAFLYSVLNYTGKELNEVLLDKYIEKISNGDMSNSNISKLENAFRKMKLKKLNDENR